MTGRVTHFGLGPHLKADVLRVEWTNGVPETVYFPGTDQDVLERELLKGSCPFLYTWDGRASDSSPTSCGAARSECRSA